MTKIIGVNGFKRSGKGETAAAVTDLGATLVPGFTTTEVGFADKLKILAAKTLGFIERSDEECIALMNECKEEWLISIRKRITFEAHSEAGGVFPFVEEAEWHRITGREYLQNLGNEARAVFGADFWVDQVLLNPANIDERDWSQNDNIEEYVAEQYGTDYVLITDLRYENEARRVLDCGGEVWEVLRPGTGSDGHASEQPLPRELVTRQIDNSGDLLALRYEVEKALGL